MNRRTIYVIMLIVHIIAGLLALRMALPFFGLLQMNDSLIRGLIYLFMVFLSWVASLWVVHCLMNMERQMYNLAATVSALFYMGYWLSLGAHMADPGTMLRYMQSFDALQIPLTALIISLLLVFYLRPAALAGAASSGGTLGIPGAGSPLARIRNLLFTLRRRITGKAPGRGARRGRQDTEPIPDPESPENRPGSRGAPRPAVFPGTYTSGQLRSIFTPLGRMAASADPTGKSLETCLDQILRHFQISGDQADEASRCFRTGAALSPSQAFLQISLAEMAACPGLARETACHLAAILAEAQLPTERKLELLHLLAGAYRLDQGDEQDAQALLEKK